MDPCYTQLLVSRRLDLSPNDQAPQSMPSTTLLLLKFNYCCRWYWRRHWHPTPVLLLGKSHRWRSLEGCSPWGGWGLDTTDQFHFHFSLSCIGEGNGNPLQCSCLENPRDRGVWWAAVGGVAQNQTQLKWLSSSSLCKKVLLLVIKSICKMTVEFEMLEVVPRAW